MKTLNLIFSTALLIGVMASSCMPDLVEDPNENAIGAFENYEDHTVIAPPCSPISEFPLVAFNYMGSGSDATLGHLKVGNNESEVAFLFGSSSFVFDNSAIWYNVGICGTSNEDECPFPKDQNGNANPGEFQEYITTTPPQADVRIKIPLSSVEQSFSACAWTHATFYSIDPATGNAIPSIETPLWAVSKSVTGGAIFDFSASMGGCPGACEPWIGATVNPCNAPSTSSAPPSCVVPRGIGPGDDLSEFNCQGKSKKVTVCHVPPGNPANMHEICISINALPAHIEDFKPANNLCMGHHSGCHLGPCDPCGPGSTLADIANLNVNPNNCPGN